MHLYIPPEMLQDQMEPESQVDSKHELEQGAATEGDKGEKYGEIKIEEKKLEGKQQKWKKNKITNG